MRALRPCVLETLGLLNERVENVSQMNLFTCFLDVEVSQGKGIFQKHGSHGKPRVCDTLSNANLDRLTNQMTCGFLFSYEVNTPYYQDPSQRDAHLRSSHLGLGECNGNVCYSGSSKEFTF